MIEDAAAWRTADDSNSPHDVCILGAGAAGITLAMALEGQGKRVLLLEAGGMTVEETDQDPYRSEVLGDLSHIGIHDGRFRGLGGTTTRWGGQILEFTQGDFAARAWVPGSGWPISKEDLAPFYGAALRSEGLDGALRRDDEVWSKLRLGTPDFGPDIDPFVTRWCPEPNFARLFGRRLRDSRLVDVLLNATALFLHTEGGRTAGVTCRTSTGDHVTYKAKALVVSMGTIETVRFFLQPAHDLTPPWSGHPALGASFQDHVDADVAEVRPINRAAFNKVFDNIYIGGFKYHPKFRLSAKLQERERTLNVGGTMHFHSAPGEDVDGLKAAARRLALSKGRNISATDVRDLTRGVPSIARHAARLAISKRAYNSPRGRIFLRAHCEQSPDTRNSIKLSPERDANGMLRTSMSWTVNEPELRTMDVFAQVMAATLKRVNLAHLDLDPAVGTSSFRTHCRDANHQMSGMRMASSPRDGLVDTDLRVHGMENLFVCSAAVFPTSSFSNPTHTLLALTHRLAAHLLTHKLS